MNAVWAKSLRDERNITITFQYHLQPTRDTCLRLAASNLYRLMVNDCFVGYGPARAAKGYSRVDCYDLGKWANTPITISVDVHSANINSFYAVEEPPFFAAEIVADGELCATAADFQAYPMLERVQKVCRFSFQRGFTEAYHLWEDPMNIYLGRVQGREAVETEPVSGNLLLPRYVHYPKLNEQPAQQIVAHGSVAIDRAAAPWTDRAYEIDNVKLKGFAREELETDLGKEICQFRYTADNCEDVLGTRRYRIYDFGRTITGFFRFTVRAHSPATVYISFDEILSDGNIDPFRNTCCNVLKYTFQPGAYDCIAMEANTAKYAVITVAEGEIDITSFRMVLYENPDADRRSFDYRNERLNKIVEAARNTLAQNAVDVLMDCPSRERAGWLCDAYFTGRAEAFFTGENLVEKSFLENYALAPASKNIPPNMVDMCYPADHLDGEYIPNWSMWYILELQAYVERTGDRHMADISADEVLGLLDFFKKYENELELLEDLEGWIFIEWSKCNDDAFICGVNYPSNMLWAAALEAAAKLYGLPQLQSKAERIRKVIREYAYNGEFFEDNAIRNEAGELVKTGHTSETAQYYAFYFGTAARKQYPKLFDRLLTEFGPKRDATRVWPQVYPSNAIVGNYLRLEILMQHGLYGKVLEECMDFFSVMADTTGTLWEHSHLEASLNHGFASVAAVYIDECFGKL